MFPANAQHVSRWSYWRIVSCQCSRCIALKLLIHCFLSRLNMHRVEVIDALFPVKAQHASRWSYWRIVSCQGSTCIALKDYWRTDIIKLLLQKRRLCKTGRERFTPYLSEEPYRKKEQKGKTVQDKKGSLLANQNNIGPYSSNVPVANHWIQGQQNGFIETLRGE